MKMKLTSSIANFVSEFAKFYHEYKVKTEHLRSVKYRIITTLAEYNKYKKVELALTDRPGDILPPISLVEIKDSPDIIAGMHPVDVNSINDLYYLSKDKVTEMRVSEDKIISISEQGVIKEYNMNDSIDIEKILSTRVSYMIGYMQAEKLLRETYKERIEYKIVADNIVTLQIEDNHSGKSFLKNPIDILFSGEYRRYSKDDVARIGYICGQMTRTH